MKITIESTSRVVTVQQGGDGTPVNCRVWEGQTDSGIPVFCLIPRIAAKADQDLSQFERELKECAVPSVEAFAVWPLRMIL